MRQGIRVFGPVVAAGAAIILLGGCVPPPAPPTPPVVDSFTIAGAPFTDPALVPFAWAVRDINGDDLTCRIDGDGDGNWEVTMSPCQPTGSRNIPAGEGDHEATLEVFDATHPPVTATASYSVAAGPTEPYDIEVVQTTSFDWRVEEAIDEAVALWESVLATGVPDMSVLSDAGSCGSESPEFDDVVDDIAIFVQVEPDVGAFGMAYPCVTGPDLLARLALIQLNEPSIAWFHANGHLTDLVAHEIGHTLGFAGFTWNTLVPNPGTDAPYFTGPRAIAEYSALGGAGPVPVEPGSGAGHWDERLFQPELMTCYLEANVGTHPLSALTVAALADVGHHVDMSAAEPYTLPPSLGNSWC